jgi:hypothetical protein
VDRLQIRGPSVKAAQRRPSGFIEPCLPSKVDRPPTGPLWVHEISCPMPPDLVRFATPG